MGPSNDLRPDCRPIVGLTGGIGSGKSAATSFFADLGVTIVDSDIVARRVVEPGTFALEQIRNHFGAEILLPNGALNRSALRQRVFAEPVQKTWLENLLHPLIRKETIRQLNEVASQYGILSSPLLLETRQNMLTDRVLVIDAPEHLQIKRTQSRDATSSDAVSTIMATQWNRDQRLAKADDLIVNDGDLQHLQSQVILMHEKYCSLQSSAWQT